LILAHLLGDFVLQPYSLVLWKNKKTSGLYIHILIHFIVNVLILSPLILVSADMLMLIIGICITHFFIDSWKIKLDKKIEQNKHLKAFILDQTLHFATIFAAVSFMLLTKMNVLTIFENSNHTCVYISIYLSLLIILVYVVPIYQYQKTRLSKGVNVFTKQSLKRAIILTIIFIILCIIAHSKISYS